MADTRITDAEIAGIMGWRGPGAYTEASLRKIRGIVDHVLRAEQAAVSETKGQELRDVFDAAWNQALSDAAFYVEGHCADGAHHVEHILELVQPKVTVGGLALASRPAEVDDKRHQDLIDVFDLTWNVAVESAAFYVDGHCADGAHHVEHILELVPPKIVVGGITVAEVRARRAKADAELWETAMSHAAMYVENHCLDGEDHASHMMSMKRPEFGAAPSHTTNKENG